MKTPLFKLFADITVIGIGAMGSATLYQLTKLASEGTRILGIEQFEPGHDQGSSHGGSRIIRLATAEGDRYVQLAKRSLEMIQELEKTTNTQVYFPGGMIASPQEELPLYKHTIEVALRNNIEHHILSSEQLVDQYKTFLPEENIQAYVEPTMGTLDPEALITMQTQLAIQNGAVIHTNEKLLSYKNADDGTVEIITDKNTYRTNKLIVTAGAWIPDLCGKSIKQELHVQRATQMYFKIKEGFICIFQA